MKRRGLTLVEILVVSGVFTLILGLITHSLAMAYRAQARTSSHTESYRSGLLTAARLERELSTCSNFLSPLPLLAGVTTPTSANPLRFVRNDENSAPSMTTGVTVTYHFDPLTRNLVRSDTRNPRPRVVAQGVQSFTVDAQARHVDVVLQLDYAPDPIRLHTTPCHL